MRHALLAASILVLATPAHAVLRSPQVPITGTGLQSLLDAQGQTIDVTTDQHLASGFTGIYLTRPATHFFVQPLGTPTDALVVYDTFLPSPTPLYAIAPAGLADGWFTEVGFDGFTRQMFVNVYDANGILQSSATHPPELALTGLGLATNGPGGVFYAFDELNPDQRAHVLVYRATGLNQGGTWFCAETRTEANGGDFDFTDAVYLLEGLNVTPISRTTWGTLKARFR